MGGLLALAASATGALAGFVGGVALQWVEWRVPAAAVAVALAATVVLDALVAPPSVRRQVPQLWGRVFSARATALLYGARLGVGPLTILRTWWWWLAFALGAVAGVWPSVAVGVAFGAGRVGAMLLTGPRVNRAERRERLAVLVSVGVAVLAVAGVLSGGLSPGARAVAATPASDVRCVDACMPRSTAKAVPPAELVVADEALATSLPDDAGPGFRRVRDEEGAALGPLDLTRAAGAEADASAERALLETRHFVAGHARAWKSEHGALAYAAAYRFASPADASAYLVDGFITLDGRGARSYDVADPHGARGFSQASSRTDGGDVAHGVAFVRDDVFFLVFVSARESGVRADDAQRLARLVDSWQGAH